MNRISMISGMIWAGLACGMAAGGDIDERPPTSTQWELIGFTMNPAFEGDHWGRLEGRGSVDYAFRMSRTEVSSADWMEFAEMFSTMSDKLDELLFDDVTWAARRDFTYRGPGNRYVYLSGIEEPGRSPISVSWRQAAMYCNWLHNGKSSDPATLYTGVYETDTFGKIGSSYTDQSTRNCDAKYWIPSLDEYLKAMHFDPNHPSGTPGWWDYGHSSDELPISGLPGAGDTIRGLSDDEIGMSSLLFPLGAFTDVVSPWGIQDAIGGSMEWTEEWDIDGFGNQAGRIIKDSSNSGIFDPIRFDNIAEFRFTSPDSTIASFHICSHPELRADLDLDGRMTFFDVSFFIQRFLSQSMSADLNCDGLVDTNDIVRFLEFYHQ